MDDEDFRALIALVEEQLRSIGASDMADERHYLRLDRDGGEARLLDPQKRLIEMLFAFERKLAIEDRETYAEALRRMDRSLYGEGPRGAVFERTGEDDRPPILVNLGQAPDLREVRERSRFLVARLLESRLPPGRLA